jgi:hypothetical protein
MKRRTLIFLVIAMVLTFAGLVVLQARHISTNAKMIEGQFRENVQSALSQTVTLIEENEALEYLSQTLSSEEYDPKKSSHINIIYGTKPVLKIDTIIPENQARVSVQLSTGHGKATIEETSLYLQRKFQKNFSPASRRKHSLRGAQQASVPRLARSTPARLYAAPQPLDAELGAHQTETQIADPNGRGVGVPVRRTQVLRAVVPRPAAPHTVAA